MKLSKPELIVNPVTNDQMTFLESSPTYVKILFELPPGAKGSPLHYHTAMGETFTVLEGCLDMEVGKKGQQQILQAGESVNIPVGTHHSFCNSSDEWVIFTTENKPAAGFEKFIRGLYGLAIDNQVNPEGMPNNLLQLAILLKYSDTIPVGVPLNLFRLLINFLVRIAGFFQIERSLTKYWH